MYETFHNTQEEQLYAPESPFPMNEGNNTPITPYNRGTPARKMYDKYISTINTDKDRRLA